MTAVNVTTDGRTTVVEDTTTNVVSVTTTGPQGATGGFSVDTTAKVDRSVVYYDSTSGQFKADAIITKTTLTDGGNF